VAEIPPERPFPLPYHDDFAANAPGTMAKYFSDQGGIFEVARRSDGRGNCLRQVMDKEGIRWPGDANPAPESFLGSTAWRDYRVSSAVRIERAGSVSLFGRVASVPQPVKEPKGYRLRVDDAGNWELRTDAKLLASGKVAFSADIWHTLTLDFKNQAIRAAVNGVQVADVADPTYASGLSGVGSGWNRADFDDFDVR
jgi:galactosylceramidase